MEYFVNDVIDGNSLTLNEFLDILINGNYLKLYPNNCFPSNKMLEEFLKIVKNMPDKDIKKIIFRFLIKEGTYGLDGLHKEYIMKNKENYKNSYEIYPIYTNRLVFLGKPWEGLTWLLDLLPDYPKDVINVLDSFLKYIVNYYLIM
jgi:restriction system protein